MQPSASATVGPVTDTSSHPRGETKKASFNLPVDDLAALKELCGHSIPSAWSLAKLRSKSFAVNFTTELSSICTLIAAGLGCLTNLRSSNRRFCTAAMIQPWIRCRHKPRHRERFSPWLLAPSAKLPSITCLRRLRL